MADALISQLPPAAAALNSDDLFEIEQGVDPENASGKITLGEISDFIIARVREPEGTTNTSAFRLLYPDDAFTIQRMSRATAQTVLVPLYDELDPWPIGTVIEIVQEGDGAVSIEGDDPAVVIRSFGSSLTLKGKHARAFLVWRRDVEDNIWDLFGDLAVDAPADPALAVTEAFSSGGTLTLDCALGKTFTTTLTENVAILTLSNVAAAGTVTEFDLLITQDDAISYTFDLPASFLAIGGSDTAISATAGSKTLLTAKTFDAGTTWVYAMQDIENPGA